MCIDFCVESSLCVGKDIGAGLFVFQLISAVYMDIT